MKWARLTRDHRFLQTYIPSLSSEPVELRFNLGPILLGIRAFHTVILFFNFSFCNWFLGLPWYEFLQSINQRLF